MQKNSTVGKSEIEDPIFEKSCKYEKTVTEKDLDIEPRFILLITSFHNIRCKISMNEF